MSSIIYVLVCALYFFPGCMMGQIHFFIMDDGKWSLPVLSLRQLFSILYSLSCVSPCVQVLHVPSIHSLKCFCSLCEVTGGFIMLLPSRRTHQGQEHLNKGEWQMWEELVVSFTVVALTWLIECEFRRENCWNRREDLFKNKSKIFVFVLAKLQHLGIT